MYRGKIIACITNRRLVEGDFLAQIECVAAMELVDWIIVREKDLNVEEYRMLFAKVARIAHKGGKKCLAHGRIALGMMACGERAAVSAASGRCAARWRIGALRLRACRSRRPWRRLRDAQSHLRHGVQAGCCPSRHGRPRRRLQGVAAPRIRARRHRHGQARRLYRSRRGGLLHDVGADEVHLFDPRCTFGA